jgi:hypothetical protein
MIKLTVVILFLLELFYCIVMALLLQPFSFFIVQYSKENTFKTEAIPFEMKHVLANTL